MNPLSPRLSLIYQKNQHFIENLLLRHAPDFIWSSQCESVEKHVPVFTFHGALPEVFELQCQHLVENGYRTLSADEFLAVLESRLPVPNKSVFLTFDDGLKHVWTVVYPLLKKFGLNATCFLIPGCINQDDRRVRPNLEDFWRGEAELSHILNMSTPDEALATWDEIAIMHESGIIDFQSHTMYHGLVFTSSEVFDFVNPWYDPYFYGNISIPIYQVDGKDIVSRKPLLGMPIYYGKPRMQAEQRYFDDERLRASCLEMVEKNGGVGFFKGKGWRKKLLNVVNRKSNMKSASSERMETLEERDRVMFEELALSKKFIEERLTGKKVVHLCYPWYHAEDFAVRASQRAGFRANYFGQRKGRLTNKSGDDPFNIIRVDEIYLRRLPGHGRQSIADVFQTVWDMRSFSKHVGFGGPVHH